MRPSLSGLTVLVAASLSQVRPAEACGGFFCNNLPIEQSAEHIAFGVDVDSSGNVAIETHVQISFKGSAQDFAWVVPLHARPTLDVGTEALFSYLDGATQPYFNLKYDEGSTCGGYQYEDAFPTAGGGLDAGVSNGGVHVIEQSDVGPYVATILTATDAGELTTWLRDNGYNLTDQGAEALTPYVGQGYFFVALKLQANRGTGDLKPIVLKMENTTPCIPIRLTAIAASADMPILAYFFSKGRAVPTNFRHVIVNEEAIDWMNYGSNYRQLATAAVSEAGGKAFLTEFAGATSKLGSARLYTAGRYDTAALAQLTDPVEFMETIINSNYPRPGMLALLERYIPEPASLVGTISEQQFYNNLRQYQTDIANDPNRDPFDAPAFAAAIESELILPLKNGQALMDKLPYTTRLYTTMSPQDMTLDPDFDFNTELPDVSNQHEARATCLTSGYDGPVEITLADGRSFMAKRGDPLPKVPAAGIIEQLAPQGQPKEIVNNVRVAQTKAGCNCGSGDATGLAFGLALLALALRRKRRE